MVKLLAGIATASLLIGSCTAHPGHDVAKEIKERAAFLRSLESPDLSHCAKKFEQNNLQARIAERRVRIAKELREARGIKDAPYLRARDFASVLATDHHSNLTMLDPATAASTVFGKSRTAVLAPEQIEGPFWVTGEMVRRNISEKQGGIDLILDIQLVDYKTCDSVSNVAVDIWHSNSTGVYSGVVSPINSGNANDLTNINSTFFRGVQMADKDGVIMFHTKVPGHYGGRTQHIHLMSQHNVTVHPNKTISGGRISHVGQMYFDQSLIDQVEKVEPYASNNLAKTPNKDDYIMRDASAGPSDDPVLEYVYLGKTVADGIFAWINVGIDPTANKSASVAATYGSQGGHMNPNPFGNFPFPSGFSFPPFTGFPSGFAFPTAFPGFPASGFPGFPSGFPFPGMPSAANPPVATSTAVSGAAPSTGVPKLSSTLATTTSKA